MVVLDCSAAMAIVLADEDAGELTGLEDALAGQAAVVPSLWSFEAANALARAERRGRLLPGETRAVVDALEQLPVIVDDVGCATALHDVLDIARATGLTAYDAAYLELAQRLGVPLATLDRRLAAAAEACGVTVL